jgi:hypothetical protein
MKTNMPIKAKESLHFYRLGDQVGFSFLAPGDVEEERTFSPDTVNLETLVSLLAKHRYSDDAHRLKELSAQDVLKISDNFSTAFKAELLASLALLDDAPVYCDDCKCHHS